MDGAALSPYPHHLWLGYGFEAPADMTAHCWILNGHAHALHMVFRGPHDVRWISRGRETRYTVRAGSFHYLPADDAEHTIIARPAVPIRSFTVFVPPRHLEDVADADHMDDRVDLHRLLVHDDSVLQACMGRLATERWPHSVESDSAKDEAARRLVLRIVELCGGGAPDWQADGSTFTNRTMRLLVDHIDAHLRVAPSISDMALLTGISPSHFAKKFRRSTGLSLLRFVNRRRLRRSLDLLRHSSASLADVALQLGFASQAHFTHQFSALTCMTPARFRKQFRRTIAHDVRAAAIAPPPNPAISPGDEATFNATRDRELQLRGDRDPNEILNLSRGHGTSVMGGPDFSHGDVLSGGIRDSCAPLPASVSARRRLSSGRG